MFEKNLLDLVKGIRSHKGNEAQFISDCIREIKSELTKADPDLKAEALNKLTYLHMLGYDMSWAAFWMVEVMALPWFGHKRVAFLAASQCFTPETEVSLLTTHLFKKAFTLGSSAAVSSGGASSDGTQYEVGWALNCLANIANPELAQELLSDLYGMLNSTRPYIRKKAVLVLFKLFQQWPKALRLSFPRLKEKLEDTDHAVVSSAVNVICELARKNPKNYLSLAPTLFKLMTTSSNNWMLIKIVKLLGTLVPEEPRLAKKLAEPLAHLISTTPAKSLLYECISTVIAGESIPKTLLQLCLDKLRTFVEDSDQNLKYLGLLGLHRLMQKQPRVVSEYKDVVLQCLKDEDVSIRMRALDLLNGMVSIRNLQDIIHRLMEHVELSEGQAEYVYRETVFARIIQMCSQDNYAFVQDLQWYISILIDLSFVSRVSKDNARLLADQLLDVAIRVPAVRPFAVKAMTKLLLENRLLSADLSAADAHMTEVLFAAAYIVGEYSRYCTTPLELVRALLQPCVSSLPPHVQACFLQAVLKLYAAAWRRLLPWDERKQFGALPKPATACGDNENKDDDDEDEDEAEFRTPEMELGAWQTWITDLSNTLLQAVAPFSASAHLEVQERAVSLEFAVRWLSTQISAPAAVQGAVSVDNLLDDAVSPSAVDDARAAQQETLLRLRRLASELSQFFADALNPVHPKAQSKVPVPKGLDLDAWINEPPKEEEEPEETASDGFDFLSAESKKDSEKASAAREKSAAAARLRRSQDPFYINDRSGKDSKRDADDEDAPAAKSVDAVASPDAKSAAAAADGKSSSSSSSKSRHQYASTSSSSSSSKSSKKKQFVVQSVIDAPEDFKVSDDESKGGSSKGKDSKKDSKDGKDKKSSSSSSKDKEKSSGRERSDSGTLSDIDIDTPLRPDEVIPKSKTYAAPSSAAAAALSSKDKSEDKEKKEKRDKERSSKRSSHDKDKEERRSSRKDKEDKGLRDENSSSSSSSRRSKDSKEDKPSSPSLASNPAYDVYRGRGVIVNSDGLRLSYEARPSSARPDALTVSLLLEYASAAPAAAAASWSGRKLRHVDVHFSISSLPHVRLVDANQDEKAAADKEKDKKDASTISLARSLAPGSSAKAKIYVSTKQFEAMLSIPAKLYASAESSSQSSSSSSSSEKVKLTGTLPLPVSLFVVGSKISTDEFRDILSDPLVSCSFLRSATVTLSSLSLKQALEAIGVVGGVALVEAINFTATYYARSLPEPAADKDAAKQQQQHVCLLVKAARDSAELSLDIKSTQQRLADAVMESLLASLK